MIPEDEYITINSIQHYVFCPRQWALIEFEDVWTENALTVVGSLIHERAHDQNIRETRGAKFVMRGMDVVSRRLGLIGKCDVVEFHSHDDGVTLTDRRGKYLPRPVEYKKGKPKRDRSDTLQLVAQAVCLEEMLLCTIEEADLYYHGLRRRETIEITQNLRNELEETVEAMRKLRVSRRVPCVKISKRCQSCSISQDCLPHLQEREKASTYIERMLRGEKD